MDTATIEDLPPELVLEIFKLFDLNQPKDLKACSMINKRWHALYVSFSANHLAALQNFERRSEWIPRKPANADTIGLDLFTLLSHQDPVPLISKIKSLLLSGQAFEQPPRGPVLNCFKSLKNLQIDFALMGTKEFIIRLPNLVFLAFHHTNNSCPVKIDCPNLNTLLYPNEPVDLSLLTLIHPETIIKLATNMELDKLRRFTNVRRLVTMNMQLIDQDTLTKLPRLSVLHLNSPIPAILEDEVENAKLLRERAEQHNRAVGLEDVQGPFDEDRVEHPMQEALVRVKAILNVFMAKVKEAKRPIIFRFAGFRLDLKKLEEIDFGVHIDLNGEESASIEYIYMKNYHLLERDSLDFLRHINYNKVIDIIPEIPKCFAEKFTGVEEVRASAGNVREDRLIAFLEKMPKLKKFHLIASDRFSQTFYDRLPDAVSRLADLRMDQDDQEEVRLDFRFVSKLKRLTALFINNPMYIQCLPQLVANLEKLSQVYLCIVFKQSKYSIRKQGTGKILIMNSQLITVLETTRIDQVLNFFEIEHL